jgi:proteic killer suppression protein
LPPDIRRVTQRKLFMIVRTRALGDLRSPPSNRLEALRGDRAGQYSIRINDQWRICFSWSDEGAIDIDVVDYH